MGLGFRVGLGFRFGKGLMESYHAHGLLVGHTLGVLEFQA